MVKLTVCDRCGAKNDADNARFCSCGYELREAAVEVDQAAVDDQTRAVQLGCIFTVMILVALMVFGLAQCSSRHDRPRTAHSAKGALRAPGTPPAPAVDPETGNEHSMVEFVVVSKMRLAELLKDPDSAKFSNVNAYRSPNPGAGVIFCGEVNAKNSFGGYAGAEGFIANPVIATLQSADPAGFPAAWAIACDPTRLVGPIDYF